MQKAALPATATATVTSSSSTSRSTMQRARAGLVVAAAKNGRAMACDVDATKFLLARPRGAYTAARTVQQTRVFDYDGHIRRLVDSTITMQRATTENPLGPAVPSAVLTPEAVEAALRPRTEATLRAAMRDFHERFGVEPAEEYKLTVLICEDDDAAVPTSSSGPSRPSAMNLGTLDRTSVFCHIGLLPPLRSQLVKLMVAGMPRHNAAAKDSQWVRDRKAIYDAIPADVEEIILLDPESHALPEGSQTNFYVIRDGTIFTAADGILKGTVRSLVLDVCDELGIPVVLEPPVLEDIDRWEACFISSTSRLVLGAGCLEYDDPTTGVKRIRTFERNTTLDRLATAVQLAVVRKSSEVFTAE